ncbi:DUF6520 family protein [Chryseobacterium sp. M5A1_1a]
MRRPLWTISKRGKPKTLDQSRQNNKSNLMKKFILPVAIVMIGATSALASNVSKSNTKIPTTGYVFRPAAAIKCVNAHVQCDTSGNVMCTADLGNGPEQLYQRISDTSCPNALFVKP